MEHKVIAIIEQVDSKAFDHQDYWQFQLTAGVKSEDDYNYTSGFYRNQKSCRHNMKAFIKRKNLKVMKTYIKKYEKE